LTFKLIESVPKGNLNNIHNVLDDILELSVFNDDRYFILPLINNTICWTQEIYLYAILFILCSLVRYYPDYWYKNIVNNKRNRWVIHKINTIAERVYPNLMLNIIFGNIFYRFSPSQVI